jgi:hypothetical protein
MLTEVENNTPYFAGLRQIPDRPSLIVVPRTLSSQWMEQLQAFTKRGSFHILRYSCDQGSLARYFTDPKGEYKKAVGPHNRNASKVIILAEMSVGLCCRCTLMAKTNRKLGHLPQAVAGEAARCFKMPNKLGGRAAQRRAARGEPSILHPREGVRLQGTIFEVLFNVIAFDESHGLRNISLMNLAAIWLSDKALVRLCATATPIFTGPKVNTSWLHRGVFLAHLNP